MGFFDSFMGAATGAATVSIVIKAYDEYSKELEKAQKGIAATGKASTIAYTAIASAAAVAAGAMVHFAVEAARAGDVQEQFNRVVGVGGVAVLNRMQKETLGTIDKYTLMSQATNAVMRGVDAGMLPALSRLSMQMRDAGLAGADLNSIISDISIAANTGRVNALIPYGVNLDELRKQLEGASDDGERFDIVLRSVLAASDKLAKPTVDAADSVDQLKTSWTEFKVEFGEVVAPAVNGALQLLIKGFEKVRFAASEIKFGFGGGADYAKKNVEEYQTALRIAYEEELSGKDAIMRAQDLINMASEGELNLRDLLYSTQQANLEINNEILDNQHAKNEAIEKESEKLSRIQEQYKRIREMNNREYGNKTDKEITQMIGGKKPIGSNITLNTRKVDDFILTKKGEVLQTNPQDTVFGMKNPSMGGGGTVNIYIDSVQGLNAEAVADALKKKILNSIVA